jgi:16S rRNA (guanine1207-N2)-methyltransferase
LDNRARNQLPPSFAPLLLPGTELPTGKFDAVLWRIPKTQALFAQQLHALQRCTGPDTLILAGGMIKHMPEKLHELLRPLGVVEVLPAEKKARVFRIVRDSQSVAAAPVVHTALDTTLAIPELDLTLSAGPNVFARDKFDIGARFFIEQFAQLPHSAHIADLGCGNGVLGMLAKRLQPEAHIEFFDDSYQAVAAAERNYRDNGFEALDVSTGAPAAVFHVDDVFSIYRGESCGEPFDLILCNPPFHQGHVVGDQIAWQMFMQGREQLRQGGELWIVGNRHLQYHLALKKLFGNCRQIAANAKFVVLAARA